jgi:hypothetical protein
MYKFTKEYGFTKSSFENAKKWIYDIFTEDENEEDRTPRETTYFNKYNIIKKILFKLKIK